MTRITLVLEYENDADVPRIAIDTKDFGNFKLHSLQFSDALLELEVLHEYIRPVDLMAARHDDRLADQPT